MVGDRSYSVLGGRRDAETDATIEIAVLLAAAFKCYAKVPRVQGDFREENGESRLAISATQSVHGVDNSLP